jgi:mannosyltransferase
LASNHATSLTREATWTTHRWAKAAPLLVTWAAFLLRVYRLGHQSLWWDEMATHILSVMPLGDLVENLFIYRNHLPLYFLLMRLWSPVGDEEFVLRFFSVIWGVTGVILAYRVGRLVGGSRVGLVASLLLAISPFHIWYSQEARMYTMVSTCTLVCGWLLLRSLRRNSWPNWIGYGVSLLVALYTHYMASFVVLAHYVFLSLNLRRLKHVFVRWLACAGGVGLLFGAWGVMILRSGGFANAPIGWIAPARWFEPLLTLLAFSAGPTQSPRQPWGYLALGASLAAIGLCWLRAWPRSAPASDSTGADRDRIILSLQLLLFWLIVPMLLTWLISLDLPIPQKRSVYMDRYLLTSLPAFVILVAQGLVLLADRSERLAAAAGASLVVPAVLALVHLYYDPLYAREDWRSAMSYLDEERQPADLVLLRPSQTVPLVYYGDRSTPFEELPFLFDEDEKKEFLAHAIEPTMADAARRWDRAWLISAFENTNAHGWPLERNAALSQAGEQDAIKKWLDAHYDRLQEVVLTGICLTLYDLSNAPGG